VDLLITGIGELVTNAPGAADLVGAVTDAVVAVRGGSVVFAGAAASLPDELAELETIDVGGRAVLPGFVDAHTHVVFAGDRADEFARRLRGETYQEVLASGGGILSTVRATRAADEEDLIVSAAGRLDRMLRHGTTTAEAKSGYGLDLETERRCLAVIHALGEHHPVDLVPTFLGAHAVPADFGPDRDGYVRFVVEEALPACAPLAAFCDVFCDEGAFTVDESRRVLEAGAGAGLGLRVHADELAHSGGARLAAELGAASADHLAWVDEADARALAEAGTVAVLLPATTFSLRTRHYAPGRMLWDAGVTVALGTDCNPGTSYTESMPFVVALACLELGLTPEEAVWAATAGSAASLGLHDRGRLTEGAAGDLILLDAPSYRHLPYRPGVDLVRTVVKAGRPVWTAT
jgi:imidazolonepropionase